MTRVSKNTITFFPLKLHVWNFACEFLKRYASHPCLFIENVFFCGKVLKSAKNCEKWGFLQITLHTTTEQRYFMHRKSFKFSKYHSLICFLSENQCLRPMASLILLKMQTRTRSWQINFWVMHVHVLLFYNICSLTYIRIKIFVRVDEAENILCVFYNA